MKAGPVLTFISLAFVLATFPLIYFSLPVYPPFIHYVAIIVGTAGFCGPLFLFVEPGQHCSSARRQIIRVLSCLGASGARLVGLMTVVLPFFGAPVLMVFYSSWLLASIVRVCWFPFGSGFKRNVSGDPAALALFALWLMVWLPSSVHVIFHSGDMKQVLEIYHEWSFTVLRDALFASYYPAFGALRFLAFSGVTSLIFVWMYYFSRTSAQDSGCGQQIRAESGVKNMAIRQVLLLTVPGGEIRDLFSGIVIGFFVCSFLAVLQHYSVHPVFSYNISPFWLYQKRISGTFSDPNALTVAGSLILAPLIAMGMANKSLFTAFVVLSVFCLMLVTGGRTFYLALFCAVLFFVIQQRGRYRLSGRAIALLISASASVMVMLVYPQSNLFLQRCLPFVPLQRVMKTVNFETAAEMLFSRLHFARLAIEVWKDEPITGVGFGMFMALQREAAARLGFEVTDWIDNANNFYLEVLVAGGILSLAALGIFTLGLLVFYFGNLSDRKFGFSVFHLLSATPLVVFPVILFTGPHTNFYEVQALWMAILLLACESSGSQVTPVAEGYIKNIFFVGLLVCCGAVFSIISVSWPRPEFGIYADEGSTEERLFWTGRTALVQVPSAGNLSFRALQPDLFEFPLTVKARETVSCSLPGGRGEEFTVADNQWRVFSVHGTGSTVCLEVSRTWIPKQYRLGADARVLGLQVSVKR
ncbi:MAG: O-antigen ligase family protein [bacterium]|nr:O-antigen ligase family protein [bacterium]